MAADQHLIKTVLELDLASYSDIARVLEENLDVQAVKVFEDQIQSFIESGLESIGLRRQEVVLGTAGDNAILIFDNASTMHHFAEAVQMATKDYNRQKSVESAQRWFRMGAATGTVLLLGSERRIIGTTIARAVRLEAATEKGQLLIDIPTFESLTPELRTAYAAEEVVTGKRDERFSARRCIFIPVEQCLKQAELAAQTSPSDRNIAVQESRLARNLSVVATGSSAKLLHGCGLVKNRCGTRPAVWVRSETTLILGCHPISPENEQYASCAEWVLQVPSKIWSEVRDAKVTICCDRLHGGLHSSKSGAAGHVFVNGEEVEIIPLLVIPAGYTDYHHRESHPEFANIPPINTCNTVYSFNVPLSFFTRGGTEVVQVKVDGGVYWDIDYVALVMNHEY